MIGTAASVAALYDTPAKIHTYAQAVTSGNALVAINGKVEGIDSLGGVIQDEFGFMAAFLLPLLGISLVARATRREEESGRLELLLGGSHRPPRTHVGGAPDGHRHDRRHRGAFRRWAWRSPASPLGGVDPLRTLTVRPGLRLRRARGPAGAADAACPGGLHLEPARPRGVVPPARRRRRDHDLGHLALPARLGGEDGAVRGPTVVGPGHPARGRSRPGWRGAAAGRPARPGQRRWSGAAPAPIERPRGCAARSDSRSGSTGPPPSAGSPEVCCSPG